MRNFSLTIGLIFFAAGCGQPAAPCETDAECYSNEMCVEGLCAPRQTSGTTSPGPQDAGSSDAGSTDAQDAASGGERGDFGGTPPDTAIDAGAAFMDTSVPRPPAVQCIADPFVSCPDPMDTTDGNTGFGEALGPTGGCVNDFVEVSVTKEARICPLDLGDQYNSTYYECAERGLTLEATLTVLDDCDPDLIAFEAVYYPCGDGSNRTAICETLPDGRRRIQIPVPPTSVYPGLNSVSWKISTPGHNDVLFDYELEVEIR